MKAKRPISVWFTQVVLLLIAVGSGFSVYETYATLSYYSVQNMIWSSFTQWFDGLTCIGCLVALTGLCFRWRFARWLVVAIIAGVLAGLFIYRQITLGKLREAQGSEFKL